MPETWHGWVLFVASIVGAVGWLCFPVYAAIALRPHPKQYAGGPEEARQGHQQPAASHRDVAVPDTPPVQPGARDEYDKAQRQHWRTEQAYWDRQLSVAWWMNTITAAGAGVGALGLLAVFGTLWVTWGALDAERLAQRPWVLLRDITVKGDLEKDGNANFVAEFSNEGASPAFDILIRYTCWPDDFVHEDQAFKNLEATPLQMALVGHLRPGHWPYLGKDAQRGRQSDVVVDARLFKEKKIGVYCAGVVEYAGPDSGAKYQTGFARRYVPHPKRSVDEGIKGLRELAQNAAKQTNTPGSIGLVTASNDADSDFMAIGGPDFNYAR